MYQCLSEHPPEIIIAEGCIERSELFLSQSLSKSRVNLEQRDPIPANIPASVTIKRSLFVAIDPAYAAQSFRNKKRKKTEGKKDRPSPVNRNAPQISIAIFLSVSAKISFRSHEQTAAASRYRYIHFRFEAVRHAREEEDIFGSGDDGGNVEEGGGGGWHEGEKKKIGSSLFRARGTIFRFDLRPNLMFRSIRNVSFFPFFTVASVRLRNNRA